MALSTISQTAYPVLFSAGFYFSVFVPTFGADNGQLRTETRSLPIIPFVD